MFVYVYGDVFVYAIVQLREAIVQFFPRLLKKTHVISNLHYIM